MAISQRDLPGAGGTSVPVRFSGIGRALSTTEHVVFFGNNLGVECQRCGAYNQTSNGHKFCSHVSCPIALREFKRRRRKRTSTLEKVYIPQKLGRRLTPEGAPATVPVEGPSERAAEAPVE